MEYNINDFVIKLRDKMYNLFPYESDIVNELKHRDRPLHIRDVAFKDNPTMILNENMYVFEIGNEKAERDYPYYHILQDSPTIKIAGYGTKRSKGSQASIENKAERDYNKVNFNGKTFSKEYSKNIRGARNNVVKNARKWVVGNNGKTKAINPDTGLVFNRHRENTQSHSYKNEWYRYIEMMIETALPSIMNDMGMKRVSSRNTSLAEDYASSQSSEIVGIDSVDSWVSQILGM